MCIFYEICYFPRLNTETLEVKIVLFICLFSMPLSRKFYTQETHSIKCKSVQALRVGEAKVILKDEYNLESIQLF